jgi:glycosyltransferase involved in cell wall biosynthesis
MAKPVISIIITSYNLGRYIEKSLASVASQGLDEPLEILVVDDHSTDDTLTVLDSLHQHYEFELLQTPRNMGPSAARNLGLSKAKGSYVNFLDGDDELLPGKLATQLAYLRANPAIDICYTDCLLYDGDTPVRLSRLWPAASGQIYDHLLSRNCIAIHAALLKTSLAKHFRFDDSLRTSEDYDFWLRLAAAGKQFGFIDQPLVSYNRLSDGLSAPQPSVYITTYDLLRRQSNLTPAGSQHRDVHLASLSGQLCRLMLRRRNFIQAQLWLKRCSSHRPLPRQLRLIAAALHIHNYLGWAVLKLLEGMQGTRNAIMLRGDHH